LSVNPLLAPEALAFNAMLSYPWLGQGSVEISSAYRPEVRFLEPR
jgi:hypothetical protein